MKSEQTWWLEMGATSRDLIRATWLAETGMTSYLTRCCGRNRLHHDDNPPKCDTYYQPCIFLNINSLISKRCLMTWREEWATLMKFRSQSDIFKQWRIRSILTLYWACDYLSFAGIEVSLFSKMSLWWSSTCTNNKGALEVWLNYIWVSSITVCQKWTRIGPMLPTSFWFRPGTGIMAFNVLGRQGGCNVLSR